MWSSSTKSIRLYQVPHKRPPETSSASTMGALALVTIRSTIVQAQRSLIRHAQKRVSLIGIAIQEFKLAIWFHATSITHLERSGCNFSRMMNISMSLEAEENSTHNRLEITSIATMGQAPRRACEPTFVGTCYPPHPIIHVFHLTQRLRPPTTQLMDVKLP